MLPRLGELLGRLSNVRSTALAMRVQTAAFSDAAAQGWRAHARSTEGTATTLQTRALLIANSTLFGGTYFGHCGDIIQRFLKGGGVDSVLFVPYALADYEKYFGNPGGIQYDEKGQPKDHTGRPKARLGELGFGCTSIHHASDPVRAVEEAQALFIGGGNTFRLLRTLHSIPGLFETIQKRVQSGQLLFMSSSCGSACAGPTIHTSICMPICPISSFEGLAVVPFNISPHFQDPESKAELSKLGFTVSMEENREQRIRQYTDEEPGAIPVVGLREGTLLEVSGQDQFVRLHGARSARVFWPKGEPEEYQPGARLDILMKL